MTINWPLGALGASGVPRGRETKRHIATKKSSFKVHRKQNK